MTSIGSAGEMGDHFVAALDVLSRGAGQGENAGFEGCYVGLKNGGSRDGIGGFLWRYVWIWLGCRVLI